MTPKHGMSAAAVAAWRAKWGVGPHVAVDVCVFALRKGRLVMLLVERGIPPFEGRWALPGGFVQLDEDLLDAARRELAEETGLADLGDVQIDQLATFGAKGRDPRGRIVSVVYTALVSHDRVARVRGGDDAADARFFELDGATPMSDGQPIELAFDHAEVVRVAVERLRGRVTYTTAPFALMPDTFTLSELQAAYEAILGAELHRRAFRERIEGEGWVVATGETRGGKHRPARLFRARTRALAWMRPWPESKRVTGDLPKAPKTRRGRLR